MVERIVFATLTQLDIHMQEMIFDPYFILYTRVNLKWIKDLNIKANVFTTLDWAMVSYI